MLEQFERLSPTKEQIIGIYSGAYSVEEIEHAIKELVEKDLVIYIKEKISPYRKDNNLLVYCGATNIIAENADRSSTDEGDIRQIEAVTYILGNELGMAVSKFTADEDMETRAMIIDQFQKKEKLQATKTMRKEDPSMRTKQEPGSRELDYRLSKWILKNVEQLLTPDEVEKIWTELLSHYSPPTASIENVCGFTDNPLGKYQNPTWKEGDPHA